jgi:epoxyqueuosine reductase
MTRKPDEKAKKIFDKAAALGFERCGIINAGAMKGFADKLAERIARFPETERSLRFMLPFSAPAEKSPWGRSIVVCSRRYGSYRIPENLNGLIGKAYQCDERRDRKSDGYRDGILLEEYMRNELGLRTASEADSWTTAYRWAALAAGLGVIRRNNFFYGDHGSYYTLSAFLIDEELEYIHTPAAETCPDNCDRCVKNCPSGALADPYATCMLTCVSYLTSKEGNEEAFRRHRKEIGGWIYGCDVCQDVCRFNRGQLSGEREFPGLAELSGMISLEKVLLMDYDCLREVISPKFWYINPDEVWKWKRNALSAMLNDYDSRYHAAIATACHDEDEHVRAASEAALSIVDTNLKSNV